jgi:hypothetical protein
LYQELPIQPMNPAAIEGSHHKTTALGPQIRSPWSISASTWLGELPSFRWRVKPVPFGFVEAPSFNLSFHLHQRDPPQTGEKDRLNHRVRSGLFWPGP